MALTGLQIFKLLPNTNCKKCGYPTCLAFAMKLAAGKEALEKCPDASSEAKAALGAASAPPIRAVVMGPASKPRTVGEETVFFRHEKTFVHQPVLFRVLDLSRHAAAEATARLDEWAGIRVERAGEVFEVDGVALVVPSAAAAADATAAADAVVSRNLALAICASPEVTATIAERHKAARPLIVPPAGADQSAFVPIAARAHVPLVVSAPDLDTLLALSDQAQRAGVADLLLEPTGPDLAALHRHLTQIRRAALERAHPGLGFPTFVRAAAGELAKAVVGITKFGSTLMIADEGGETWTPLWTLRQNIYTDPQKPLQVDQALHGIGEPDTASPLLVTTNFSLTYFIVSTELEAAGVPCHLAVVDSEGMSVLTAWSAGKFSGERVGKALRELGATERISHRTVIIPGYVAVISGELEDTLGEGWRVVTGPQEAADISTFFKEFVTT